VLIAGAGNETLFGAFSQTDDFLWGSFTGGNDLLAAGSGNDGLVAGSGHTSLIGGSGNDTFYVTNSALVSALTKTTVTPGVDFLYNTRAGETLALTGFDTLYGAAGSGAAANAVTSALAGGGNAVTLKDGTTISFVTGVNGIHLISS
jgi:Ca2+-binding RTX toxin-like protein